MITSIQGTLTESGLVRAVVEVGGLGYEVHVPVTTAERLPPKGSVVKLHTLAIYREDSQALYGFATPEDRDFFRLMIENVTGIGPKVALSIMSRLSLPLLQGRYARATSRRSPSAPASARRRPRGSSSSSRAGRRCGRRARGGACCGRRAGRGLPARGRGRRAGGPGLQDR